MMRLGEEFVCRSGFGSRLSPGFSLGLLAVALACPFAPATAAEALSESSVNASDPSRFNLNSTGRAFLPNADRQSIGYTGYLKDEALGLYYANARWYDPLTGSFVSMDPAHGRLESPITFNKYLYANSNPLFYVDPSGRYAEAGHFYVTYYSAIRSGFSNEEAQEMAFYSQLPDEVDRLDATGVQVDTLSAEFGAALAGSQGMSAPMPDGSERNEVQTDLHSLTGRSGNAETQRTLRAIERSGNLAATGILVHRLADSFAHRDRDGGGKTYQTGMGHARDGHDPDTIQRNPEQFLEYVTTLTTALARQRGHSEKAIVALAARVRAELSDVANIKTVVYPNSGGTNWKPTGWMQSPPADVYAATSKNLTDVVTLSNRDLEAISIQRMQDKLKSLGADLRYKPEDLPTGFGAWAVFVPNWEARSVEEAVGDFRNAGGKTSNSEAEQSVKLAQSLLGAPDSVSACVVIELPSGGRGCRP